VIFETDQALATLLKTKVLGGAPIAVAFDPPSRPWIQALKAPTVNLFMFDLRENGARRESSHEDVRDATGKVIARRGPMQRWDLHYTVSVFAPQVLVEHKVLAIVLRYLCQIDIIPEDVLPAPLAELGYPILVSTGAGAKRGMFLNYAGDIKASFEMTITVPMPPAPPPPPAAPVQRPPEIRVNPEGPPTAAPNVAGPSETVAPPAAAPPAAPAAAPASAAPAAGENTAPSTGGKDQ
jgi:Pvc16 N-terminal domain